MNKVRYRERYTGVNITKRALVLSYTDLKTDPRVQKQIEWLIEDKWSVDTLGYGVKPNESVNLHFEIRPQKSGRGANALGVLQKIIFSRSLAFKMGVVRRLPTKRILEENLEDAYELVVVNDIDLLPWVVNQAPNFKSNRTPAHIHLDIHEYHSWSPVTGLPKLLRNKLKKTHAWQRDLIRSEVFSTRSTVAEGIAKLYSEEFDIDEPVVIRNSRKLEHLKPSQVNTERIELVYHGNSELARGLDILIEAASLLDDRFRLNLMLTGNPDSTKEVIRMSRKLGQKVQIHDPVTMNKVSEKLNEFDIEIIFYPPTTINFQYSFPNKFFESIQARLALAIGQSPSMEPIVNEFNNGVIVEGWRASDLARSLNQLDATHVFSMKQNSDKCAPTLDIEMDKKLFLQTVKA